MVVLDLDGVELLVLFAQLVERAATILENMGVRVLGPDEVRDKLHLTKRG